MGNNRLASLYWVTALFSHFTDGCIKFAASPSTINLAYTKEMFVKCSMMHTQTVNVSSITSISISRSRANQSSTVLGIIEKSKGDKFSGIDGISDVVTKGYFDNKNVSSLSLLWKRPSLDDVGEYTCQFAGRDKNGMTFNLTESLTITYEIPTALCPNGNERWQNG
ncbi:hypothetical protein Btru_071900 [Bulinus truncatus]|nr:hypothetical protein Btru_071900 [Bulinus truncatus]